LFKGLAWESLNARYPFDKKYPSYLDDRQHQDILQKVLEDRMLWPDPKDADIKLPIKEKCAAYGSQTLKEIFEKKNQSAPSARAEIARQEKVTKRTAPRKVQAKGKSKTTKNKGKGKAKASSVDEDDDEDSDFEMKDVESEHTLTSPPPR
jgi:hypothetical protein